MPRALQHEYPRWESDERDPTQDVQIWPGHPRFVSAARARKLRKRGVPLMKSHITANGHNVYAWFEPAHNHEDRKARKGARCYEMHHAAQAGRVGRKYKLHAQLGNQRLRHLCALLTQRRWWYMAKIYACLHYAPTILQREEETYREFLQRHLAAGNVPTEGPYNAGIPAYYEPNDYTREFALRVPGVALDPGEGYPAGKPFVS